MRIDAIDQDYKGPYQYIWCYAELDIQYLHLSAGSIKKLLRMVSKFHSSLDFSPFLMHGLNNGVAEYEAIACVLCC